MLLKNLDRLRSRWREYVNKCIYSTTMYPQWFDEKNIAISHHLSSRLTVGYPILQCWTQLNFNKNQIWFLIVWNYIVEWWRLFLILFYFQQPHLPWLSTHPKTRPLLMAKKLPLLARPPGPPLPMLPGISTMVKLALVADLKFSRMEACSYPTSGNILTHF